VKFERLRETDVLELCGGGSGAKEVAVVELLGGSVRRPSRSRSCERMFAPMLVMCCRDEKSARRDLPRPIERRA
jgi:hypothetical protein